MSDELVDQTADKAAEQKTSKTYLQTDVDNIANSIRATEEKKWKLEIEKQKQTLIQDIEQGKVKEYQSLVEESKSKIQQLELQLKTEKLAKEMDAIDEVSIFEYDWNSIDGRKKILEALRETKNKYGEKVVQEKLKTSATSTPNQGSASSQAKGQITAADLAQHPELITEYIKQQKISIY